MNVLPKLKLPDLQAQKPRAGFSMLELLVSLILVGTAMAIIVPTLARMGGQNRLSLQHQEALEGLDNLMEDLTARPYEELTPDLAKTISLPESLFHQLPGAKLEVEITEAQGKPKAKRIVLRLSWNQRNGQPRCRCG